jgi:hypothetical protein
MRELVDRCGGNLTTCGLHRRTKDAVYYISTVRRSQKLVGHHEGATNSKAGQQGSNFLAVVPERIPSIIFSQNS